MNKTTKNKLLIGGALVVVAGIGGYFLWKYLKKKKEQAKKNQEDALRAAEESAKPKAPSESRPKPESKKPVTEQTKPSQEVFKIGDSVTMAKPDYWWKKDKNEAYKFIKDTSGKNVYVGKADIGAYAGVIQSIPKTGDFVVVSNFTLRPSNDQSAKSGDSTFRIDKKSLKKKESSEFNGVTVTYQPSDL